MHEILRKLCLSLRPEKTFVGRSDKGFDLLGYHITPHHFSSNQKTQEKTLENAKRRYVQRDKEALAKYLDRWRTWIHAGFPFKIDNVEEIINSIRDFFIQNKSNKIIQTQICIRFKKFIR